MSRPTHGPGLRFPVRGCHPLWPAVPGASGTSNPSHWPVPRSLATTDGISRAWLAPRPLLMSVPPATEMFQFAGFASCTYGLSTGYPLRGGLPHSEIPGSPIARISPGLFAACHVLHRLSVPRHPPDALLRLFTGLSHRRDRTTVAHRVKPRFRGTGSHARQSRMKTLLEQTPSLSNAGLSASVTSSTLSSPFNRPRRRARLRRLFCASPNALARPQGGASRHRSAGLAAGETSPSQWWR